MTEPMIITRSDEVACGLLRYTLMPTEADYERARQVGIRQFLHDQIEDTPPLFPQIQPYQDYLGITLKQREIEKAQRQAAADLKYAQEAGKPELVLADLEARVEALHEQWKAIREVDMTIGMHLVDHVVWGMNRTQAKIALCLENIASTGNGTANVWNAGDILSDVILAGLNAGQMNWGDFAKEVSFHPSRIGMLNGNGNYRGHPNQDNINEWLEALTVGVPVTNEDRDSGARVLMGWRSDRREPIPRFMDPGPYSVLGQTFTTREDYAQFLGIHSRTVTKQSARLLTHFRGRSWTADELRLVRDTWGVANGRIYDLFHRLIDLPGAFAPACGQFVHHRESLYRLYALSGRRRVHQSQWSDEKEFAGVFGHNHPFGMPDEPEARIDTLRMVILDEQADGMGEGSTPDGEPRRRNDRENARFGEALPALARKLLPTDGEDWAWLESFPPTVRLEGLAATDAFRAI